MDTHGIPNDVVNNLDPFALIIFIPICDLLIYPALRKAGINFSALKKITAGFFLGSMAMVWAAVVQYYVYKTNPCHESAATCKDAAGDALTSPLNVWIQTGAYVLIAFSEILASITGLEYAFTKACVGLFLVFNLALWLIQDMLQTEKHEVSRDECVLVYERHCSRLRRGVQSNFARPTTCVELWSDGRHRFHWWHLLLDQREKARQG